MEGCQNFDLEIEADDNQFTENQLGFSTSEFAGGPSAEEKVDMNLGIDANDHLPELNESIEPEKNQRNGRYNLRKSLAWDSAFFTNAGVLDAEELSSMINGADISEKHQLPRIQEDVTESMESISTLGGDGLNFETREDDLFVDIRASIQRSSKKKSNFSNPSNNTTAIDVDNAAVSSMRNEDLISQNKIPKPVAKKTSSLQTVRMAKSQPQQNIMKVGPKKATKHDSVPLQMMSNAKIGEKNPILPKVPKTTSISRSIPSSTSTAKRDSMGTGRVKSECGSSKLATVSSKRTEPLKVSVPGGARRALPKPAGSPKCSILGSPTTSRGLSTRSSTSSDSSSNMSSGTSTKTALTARRNPVKSSNIGTASSGSIPKTPSRDAVKNKSSSSSLAAHLISAKISSSVSPASSISEWSSASSSSSSMINQRSNNLRTSLDTGSCRSMDGDILPSDPRSANQSANEHQNQRVSLTSNISKKSSAQTGNLQASVKPSGLRMPSPKIGFFDGVKSSGRTPNAHQQSQSGLPPKNAAATSMSTQSRSSNSKLKSTKGPTARTGTSLASIKPASPKLTSPASSEEKSHALVNSSGVSVDTKGSASPRVKGFATGQTYSKAEKVKAEDVVKQVVDDGTGVISKENLGDLDVCSNVGFGDVKTSSPSVSEYINLVKDDVLVKHDHLQKSPHPVCEATDKENEHAKYQGEGLTGDKRGTIDMVHGSTDALLSDTSVCVLSSPATAFEPPAGRAPFALMNYSCSNETIDMPKELSAQVVVADKTSFALLSSEQKENS